MHVNMAKFCMTADKAHNFCTNLIFLFQNDEKKVAELLAAGANPNVRDNAGWSPLVSEL